MKDLVIKMMKDRGVKVEDIARLVVEAQNRYIPVTLEEANTIVESVFEKHEVQNAILTGLALDIAAEKGVIEEPLLSMLLTDEPLYGVDEILALSITNIYGSIAFTNYGFFDKTKPGVLAKLNKHRDKQCNTFLDDLAAAVASAACSKLAHTYRRKAGKENRETEL